MREKRLIADDFLLLLRVSSRGLDLLHERSDVGFQHKRVLIEGLRELESSFGDRFGSGRALRSEVNIELNFPPKLRGARSRLYRRRFLQVNTRWKALAEIYTMHSFAPFSNLNYFVKNRQKILRLN